MLGRINILYCEKKKYSLYKKNNYTMALSYKLVYSYISKLIEREKFIIRRKIFFYKNYDRLRIRYCILSEENIIACNFACMLKKINVEKIDDIYTYYILVKRIFSRISYTAASSRRVNKIHEA